MHGDSAAGSMRRLIARRSGHVAFPDRRRDCGDDEAWPEQRRTRRHQLAAQGQCGAGLNAEREAEVLTGLKTERAAAAANAHAVEVEAPPIMYVAQFLGGTTEQAIRWLILAMVLCCDPLAIALTAAASARR
jgi:hypothetical protein